MFFQRFRESVKKAEWKVGMEAHRRIVNHLATGRVDAAADELRRHIDSHRAVGPPAKSVLPHRANNPLPLVAGPCAKNKRFDG